MNHEANESEKKEKKSVWTDDRLDKLRAWFDEGKSASEIAAGLGDNISRNAVIGRIYRMKKNKEIGFSGEKQSSSKNLRLAEIKKNDGTVMIKPIVDEGKSLASILPEHIAQHHQEKRTKKKTKKNDHVEKETIHLLDQLSHENNFVIFSLDRYSCRWPIGKTEESDFRFCCEKTQAHSVYCAKHMKDAYQQTTSRGRSYSASKDCKK